MSDMTFVLVLLTLRVLCAIPIVVLIFKLDSSSSLLSPKLVGTDILQTVELVKQNILIPPRSTTIKRLIPEEHRQASKSDTNTSSSPCIAGEISQLLGQWQDLYPRSNRHLIVCVQFTMANVVEHHVWSADTPIQIECHVIHIDILSLALQMCSTHLCQ